MVKIIAKNLLKRLGTAIAAVLLAQGVPEETVTQIVVGLSALSLVLMDLGAEYLDSREGRR